MAERRMFAKTIVLSDAFLDMPLGARCLYMTMGMLADDDGFVNNPKSIIRQCGASEDDMRILFAKKFVIPFDNGVVVIKHWRINNYLQKDRYNETKYLEEKAMLSINEKGAYEQAENYQCIHNTVYTDKDSIGKDSIGNYSGAKRERFTPPTLEEVQAYCKERHYGTLDVSPQRFIDYYTSNGWKVGRNPMKDWKAAVRNWARGEHKQGYNSDNVQPNNEDQSEKLNKLLEQWGNDNG